jgi:hypothetical protein
MLPGVAWVARFARDVAIEMPMAMLASLTWVGEAWGDANQCGLGPHTLPRPYQTSRAQATRPSQVSPDWQCLGYICYLGHIDRRSPGRASSLGQVPSVLRTVHFLRQHNFH